MKHYGTLETLETCTNCGKGFDPSSEIRSECCLHCGVPWPPVRRCLVCGKTWTKNLGPVHHCNEVVRGLGQWTILDRTK